MAVVLVGLPFLIALLALAAKHWLPSLDLAMTDLRVRDVGTPHTPLIGLPSRIGTIATVGSHPGPLGFYLLAPLYRLFGKRSFTLLLGSGLIQSAAAFGFIAVVWRVAGKRVGVASTAAIVVLMHFYGPSLLTQPLAPYLPLLCWALMLVCVWGVLSGHPRLIAVVAVTASLAAQTHASYVGISIGMGLMAVIGLIVYAKRERDIDRRVDAVQWGVWAVIVAAALSVPAVVDQFLHKPGNLRVLADFYNHPAQKAIGTGNGLKLMLRHFDLFRLLFGGRLGVGNLFFGTVFVLLWVAAVVVAVTTRHWLLLRLHIVVAWAIVLGAWSLGKIFGDVSYYLSLWAWGTATVAFVATFWTAWVAVRVYWPNVSIHINPQLTLASYVAAAVMALACVIQAQGVTPPQQRLGDAVARLVAPTMKAIGTNQGGAQGIRGHYVVSWQDDYFNGAQGLALLDELERRGYRVGSTPAEAVQVTPRRVLPPKDASTTIILAVGHSIDDVAILPGALKVTQVDPRSVAEVIEYDKLHDQVVKELTAAKRTPLVPLLDTNLAALGSNTSVPKSTQTKIARMTALGQPLAVFFVPITR